MKSTVMERGGRLSKSNSIRILDLTFVLAVVVWFSDAWVYKFDSQAVSAVVKEYSFILRVSVYLLTILYMFRGGFRYNSKFVTDKFLYIVILCYCVASAVYFDSIGSVHPISNLFLILVVAAIFSRQFQLEYAVNLIWLSMTAVIVFSLLLTFTSTGIMTGIHEGLFRGAFAHKNNLGVFVASYIAITVAYFPVIKFGSIWKIVLLTTSAYLLIRARSASSIVLVTTFLSLTMLLLSVKRIARWPLTRALVFISVSILVCFLAISLTPVLLDALGRDASLTGRSTIWEFFIERAAKRPWFGHGAFSMSGDNELIYVAGQVLFQGARSAHNGYIEIFYNLGLVGLGLYAIFAINLLFKRFAVAVGGRGIRVLFPFVFATVFFMYGFVESFQSGLNAGLPMLILLAVFDGTIRREVNQ